MKKGDIFILLWYNIIIYHNKESAMENQKQIPAEWYYFIKLFAAVCMLIDHTRNVFGENWNEGIILVTVIIGRLAFPLFAWELVQCFHFTQNRIKHFISLIILALVSEVPFDMALERTYFTFSGQNVCFTLLFGWIGLFLLNSRFIKCEDEKKAKLLSCSLSIALCIPLFVIAALANFDYYWNGVLLVLLFEAAYRHKQRKKAEIIAVAAFIISLGAINGVIHIPCLLCVILFRLAEGNSGFAEKLNRRILLCKPVKLFLRYFYPLHLLILGIIARFVFSSEFYG